MTKKKYRKEIYPEDLQELLINAKNIASAIQGKLEEKSCPKVSDLYTAKQRNNGSKFNERNKELFEINGYVPNIHKDEKKPHNEFKGLYVFGKEEKGVLKPIYVGISRTIFRRLRQHAWGLTANECSFAYLMAQHNNEQITRANVIAQFKGELDSKKEEIRNYRVALHAVPEDYNLYFYEVALAAIFKTEWNSFRTH